MARNRYLAMSPSEIVNPQGISYPDTLSMPIDKFVYSEKPLEYTLTQSDLDRIDLLMYRMYRSAAYDDIILWVNNIDTLHNLNPGDTLLLPAKKDLETFFIKHSR